MKRLFIVGATAVLAALAAYPQDTQKMTVPFRNPSQPRKLVVDVMLGSVTVRGYEGQEVTVEATGGRNASRGPRRQVEVPAGMHRIGGSSSGLDVTEDNNTVKVSSGVFGGHTDVVIQVPTQTSVSVKTMTGSAITIENVSGEIEANNMNGQVNITNVSGSVVAHSMNGKVVVSLNTVLPDKAMSFSTMNGDVDVTLPASTKANVKLKTDHGEMFTDFDVKLDSSAQPPQVEDNRKKGGRYRVRFDRGTTGTINGGGPEMQFTSFNGNILIHKK